MKALVVAVAIACVALIGLGIYFTIRPTSIGPRLMPIDPSYTARVSDGYWKKGTDNPKVIIVEYSDFQCPACRTLQPMIDQAIAQTSDIAQFRFHIFPIASHDKSMIASKAAEAAGRQGKFWPMYQTIFANQNSWAQLTPAAFESNVVDFAKSLTLNVEQFRQDMKDASLVDPIDRDRTNGNMIPIQYTPTVLINDKIVTELPDTVDGLAQLIRQSAK